ncbi:hypothetical protein ACQP6C_00030 [Snodgrassella alvi]|uniref:hypothetical protein n=1 Tax=Snodgrassella alvi TaxID=1196083 RepID=UPI003CFF182A
MPSVTAANTSTTQPASSLAPPYRTDGRNTTTSMPPATLPATAATNEYLIKAKEFTGKPLTSTMQETQVGNYVIKYDKSTGEMFVGHIKQREIRTYYIDDKRSIDPFQDAINLAREK